MVSRQALALASALVSVLVLVPASALALALVLVPVSALVSVLVLVPTSTVAWVRESTRRCFRRTYHTADTNTSVETADPSDCKIRRDGWCT